jgi:hypothetical protein
VKKLVLVIALLAAGSGPASAATRECQGFQVCVPVAGPWVVVPVGSGAARTRVAYQLSCPRRYVVGGLDAELSQRGIDVTFAGAIGSPVTPGVTTGRAVVFAASYVGGAPRAPTFRPHIGCVPSSGAGTRIPTAASVVRVGHPTAWRVTTKRVRPGTSRVATACTAKERVVGASYAFGFFGRRPPDAGLVGTLSGTQAVSGRRVVVTVRADAELGGVRAVAQVQAVCAGVS